MKPPSGTVQDGRRQLEEQRPDPTVEVGDDLAHDRLVLTAGIGHRPVDVPHTGT